MKNKKIFATVLAMILALSMFAGCNDSKKSSKSDKDTEVEDEDDDEEDDDKKEDDGDSDNDSKSTAENDIINNDNSSAESEEVNYDAMIYLIDTTSEEEITALMDSCYNIRPLAGDTLEDIGNQIATINGHDNYSIDVSAWAEFSYLGEVYGKDPWYVDGRDVVSGICLSDFDIDMDLSSDVFLIEGYKESYTTPDYPLGISTSIHVYDKDRAETCYKIMCDYLDSHFEGEGELEDHEEPQYIRHSVRYGEKQSELLATVMLVYSNEDTEYYTLTFDYHYAAPDQDTSTEIEETETT